MTRARTGCRRAEGFTLIEIVVALGVLGASLFILLEVHFASLSLFADAQDEATFEILVTQAIGVAEVEILSGDESGDGTFGSAYEGYSYTYTAEQRDSAETPGLFHVTVTIIGPEEERQIEFLVYDGLQVEIQ